MGGKLTEQDAKAKFSELIDSALAEGPQIVTRRGKEVVVPLSFDEWRQPQDKPRRNLKELLRAPEARTDNLVPPRRPLRRRSPFSTE